MGVDYSANYGIGFKVEATARLYDREDDDFILQEYLEETLSDDYRYFEVGDGSYTGEENDVYVIFRDKVGLAPLENYKDRLDVLRKHLEDLLLEVSEEGLVGGLNVW